MSDTSSTSSSTSTAVTASTVASSASDTSSSATQVAGNMSEFLTLLTTQLKNQDPMNPMDSTAFTQQLVEYSQVEQQINTNAKLDTLSQLSLNQSLSLALGYVGKDITYTSADMNFDGSTGVKVSYNLPTAATSAVANITDEAGDVIYSEPVSTTAGTSNFTWDGTTTEGTTAAAGTYSVSIAATDSTGAAETVSTAVTGVVGGVESQDGTPYLLVGDRAVALGNVINASAPSTQTASN